MDCASLSFTTEEPVAQRLRDLVKVTQLAHVKSMQVTYIGQTIKHTLQIYVKYTSSQTNPKHGKLLEPAYMSRTSSLCIFSSAEYIDSTRSPQLTSSFRGTENRSKACLQGIFTISLP